MRDTATQRQITAARPDRSTWLSANAGSGKTKVLTDRVARLLLRGVDPQNILCLTYTKAAATEMQNRLFRRLGQWAMLGDDELAGQLDDLGIEDTISPAMMAEARRLFATAIETPGGLKIQTIHSFCSSLLRRFPLEAGVTPQFTEMEDRAAVLLRAEIVEKIADGPNAEVLYALARHYTGETLESLTAEIVRHRPELGDSPDDAELAALFGQPADLTQESITAQVFLGGEADLLQDLIPALYASGGTDEKAAQKLETARSELFSNLPIFEDVFLTGSNAKSPFSAKIGSFPKKDCRESLAHLMPDLNDFMQRVEEAREARLALASMQRTRALYDFAGVFLPAYDEAKQLRGLLDFDDLIRLARDLLTDRKVADWVLYKLDGGIDHILVDEAQDTSPMQWKVIERLAQEFTSGEGARPDAERTIFVVGDKKQSIYSFQGADPREFDRMRDEFAGRLKAAENPLQDMEMEFSFRSSATILSLVDCVFEGHGESGFTQREPHRAFHESKPGRVDLWPVVEKPDKAEKPDWFLPVDIRAPSEPAILLAEQVATAIEEMIGQPLPDNTGREARPIRAGDILILVQRRSALFAEIIRACKARNLPVAGADRLRVGAELAVRDLNALLSFLATPEDSLALATALRSPLFGWTEAELYALAHNRTQKYLWAALRENKADYPDTVSVLLDLMAQTDYLRPYDIIERILTRHEGRKNLLARLGLEAEDGIDALLAQAMAYERNNTDSLTGFLVWMETDNLEIKRQMDSAGDRIRVMTAHGAKGLESPIVILPDSAKRDIKTSHALTPCDGKILWRTRSDDATIAQRKADDRWRAAQQAERDRLLYVAMTRAEQWLIVAAAGDLDKNGTDWYSKVRRGMEASDAVEQTFAGADGLRIESGNWSLPPKGETTAAQKQPAMLQPFFHTAAARPPSGQTIVSPSDLPGAKILPGEGGLDEDAAKRRGRQIHRLLEFLPQVPAETRAATAAGLLSHGSDAAEETELTLLLAEVEKVLTKTSLAPLFDAQTLAEVPVTATLDDLGGARIHGIIDRLVIEPNRILAVDFKTNAIVPDSAHACPSAILAQLGAYAAALGQIYPGRFIETAILWTRTATLMSMPHDLVTDALRNTQIS